nr:hypothetical protein [Salinispora oceanensis]
MDADCWEHRGSANAVFEAAVCGECIGEGVESGWLNSARALLGKGQAVSRLACRRGWTDQAGKPVVAVECVVQPFSEIQGGLSTASFNVMQMPSAGQGKGRELSEADSRDCAQLA